MRKIRVSDKTFFKVMSIFAIIVVGFSGTMVVASLMDGAPQEVETYTMERLPSSWMLKVFAATHYEYPAYHPNIEFLTCPLRKYNERTISVTINIQNSILQRVYIMLSDMGTSVNDRYAMSVDVLFGDIQYLGNESVIEITMPKNSKCGAHNYYVLYVAVLPMAWNDGTPVFSGETTIQLLDV